MKCGESFTAWAAAERHADGHGGARLEWLPPGGTKARYPEEDPQERNT